MVQQVVLTRVVRAALLAAILTPGAALWAQQLPELHESLSSGPAFEWVRPAALAIRSPADSGEDLPPITYLLADAQVRLPQAAPPARYYRWTYRINSRGALEDWSSWEIEFEPSYQRVVFHQLRIWRDGVWEDRVGRSRWSLLQRESDLARHQFDQRLSVLAVLEDVRVGDVVDVAYSILGVNPVFQGRYAGSYGLGWSQPVERRRVRFLVHASRQVAFRVHGARHEPARREVGEYLETSWDVEALPDYEYESDTPYDWVVYPWLQASEYATWGDVARWALPLYRVADERPRGLREVARGLRSAAKNPDQLMVSARNWVQDEIRYMAILLGEHSHAPHRTAEILRRRYGDCKDKTVLLVSLLRELGFEAWPALVNTGWRNAVQRWLPSPDAFNHVIVAVGRGERRVWIDPTLTLQGGSVGRLYVPSYGVALIVAEETEGLSPLPADRSDHGSTRAVYRYEMKPGSGAATVEIVTGYAGQQAEAMRDELAATTAEELLEGYVEFYSTPVNTIAPLGALQIEDDRSRNVVTVIERYDMEQQKDAETGLLFETLQLMMATDLQAPASHERLAPLAIPHPLRREEVVVLQARPDLELEAVNEKEQNAWFRFSARSRFLERGLEISYELETLADRVAIGDLEEYAAAATRMQDALGYAIWDWEGGADVRTHAVRALQVCAAVLLITALAIVLARRVL